jgi:hypothetical protein
MIVSVHRRRLLSAVAALFALLWIVSVAGQIYEKGLDGGRHYWVTRFDFDGEGNIPSYYQALLVFMAGTAAGLCGAAARSLKRPHTLRWAILAVTLFYVSVDEAASLHELLIDPLRDALDTRGALRFAWVIPGALAVAGFGICYFGFVRDLPVQGRNILIAGAAMYVAGALGGEIVGGAVGGDLDNLRYALVTQVEEALEVGGMLLALAAFLSIFAEVAGSVTLDFPGSGVGNELSVPEKMPDDLSESGQAATSP